MTKLTLPSRAAATAAAVLGACLLALTSPMAAMAAASAQAHHAGSAGSHNAGAASENLPLNLSTSSAGSHTASSSGGASIVRTIVGLAIVIAVIWGLSWILRQVKTGRDPHVGSAGLASVAALQIGSGRSVHLVRAGSEYVLLGSAEHGVVPIHRYTEQEARDAGLLDESPDAPRGPRSLLARLTGGERSDGSDPMRMPSPNTSLVDRLREWTVRR
jgi:flagellar protein FliO/FliZ